MKKTISEIASRLKELTEKANVDLYGTDPQIRGALEAARSMAVQERTALVPEYRQALLDNCFYIVVRGQEDSQREFADLAAQQGRALEVSYPALYRRLAKRVWDSIAGDEKVIGIDQNLHFVQELSNVFLETGVARLASPVDITPLLRTKFESLDALTQAIAGKIRAVAGESLNLLYMQTQVVQQAVAETYDQNIVPVVVLYSGKDDDLTELGQNVMVVKLKSGAEANQVKTTFNKIAEAVKEKDSN